MDHEVFDVIIIGGGPAGASCAMQLVSSGLRVAVLDKAVFPRDKTCGDGLSVDVINQLVKLSPTLAAKFDALDNAFASSGVTIFSPDHNHIDIPFLHQKKESCGYVSPRYDFDNLLFQHLKELENISTIEACKVEDVDVTGKEVVVSTNKGKFVAAMVIGADGAHSIVAKKLARQKVEKEHYCAGLRVYYENVKPNHPDDFIELHFFKELLPGYVWIFPLPNNQCNVGIGMLSSKVASKKVDLKKMLQHLITTHPGIKNRFENAKPLETVKGYGLPLGSKKRKLSGDRYLLAGDAAALIDPFTGEGIANAIRSGRVAADHAKDCFHNQDFSAAFNMRYDKEIYRRMWSELRISYWLQKLISYPSLFNFAIRRARQSKYVLQFITDALSDIEKKKKILYRPLFYFRMLFK